MSSLPHKTLWPKEGKSWSEINVVKYELAKKKSYSHLVSMIEYTVDLKNEEGSSFCKLSTVPLLSHLIEFYTSI